jgi:hypothetical protein
MFERTKAVHATGRAATLIGDPGDALYWFMLIYETCLAQTQELLYEWQFTAYQFVLGTSSLKRTTKIFILQLNDCSYSPYVTTSLTREWDCHLQLLLVIFMFESCKDPEVIPEER